MLPSGLVFKFAFGAYLGVLVLVSVLFGYALFGLADSWFAC